MGIYTVKRSLISAIVLGGLMVSAHAADLSLSSAKDALPAVPDGPITWMGVTFYGTVDVGYAYNTHGVPPSGAFYVGANSTIYGSRFANGSVSTINNNALEQSKVGLKIEENIGYGLQAIGKIETGFDPISGELADACASLIRNNGKFYNQMDNNGDGSRCGQAFNSVAYGGLSSPLYGTLTVGRQNSLVTDGMGSYDPMAGSYAFSLIGYTGTAGGGIGSTETARWDNSVKYIFTYGPFHAAGMYTSGGQDTSILGDGYGANAGITYMGFSIDGFYTKENAAVNASSWNNSTYSGNPFAVCPGGVFGTACSTQLLGTITNNEAWDVMAKYTFNVPSFFGEPAVSMKDAPCGGLKDAPCAPPQAKVTLYGGFQYVTLSNPDHAQSYYNGDTTIGGYGLYTDQNLLFKGAAADRAYGSDRVLETAWAGARYEDGPWAFTGAYYYWSQNSYIDNRGRDCPTVTTANKGALGKTFIGNTVGTNCSGDFNQGSFLIDYTFNRHFDIYAGVSFTEMSGGINSGFLQNNDTTVATGLRVKW